VQKSKDARRNAYKDAANEVENSGLVAWKMLAIK
jgi:hypothetical protein